MRAVLTAPASRAAVLVEDRRMRILAIALMCGAMLCFTGLDTSSKWLGMRIPVLQIVWARYVSATVIAFAVTHRWLNPWIFVSKGPKLQALRSLLLFGSTVCVVIALRRLQLAESAMIAFLNPIFVALRPGHCSASWSADGGWSPSSSASSAS
jgi:drug/metabolite transporter (DMT)-like permease